MTLPKHTKAFLNYFLGPLLFGWLLFSMWQQVHRQPHLGASFESIRASLGSQRIGYPLAALGLMALNWGIEALKWKLSVQGIHPLRFGQAYRAVLSGVSVSVTTPNRVGEYLGRMLYMPEGKRLRVIAVSVLGGMAQLLTTLLFGAVALVVLQHRLVGEGLLSPAIAKAFAVSFALLAVVGVPAYFSAHRLGGWLLRLSRGGRWGYLIEELSHFGSKRLALILILSLVRYGIFVWQYGLLFHFFGVALSPLMVWWVMSLVFLALAVIPTLAVVVEFGVRSEVCLVVAGIFSANTLGIALTSVTVWVINLIVPALIGSGLILRLRLFRREGDAAKTGTKGSEKRTLEP